jgi:hypothetical protein
LLSHFRDRNGRYPIDEEIRAYEQSWTESRQEGLRNAAVQLVAAYADALVNQTERQILRRALKGRFWRGVGLWLFSASLFTVALIGLVVGLSRAGIDLVEIVKKASVPHMVPKPEGQ